MTTPPEFLNRSGKVYALVSLNNILSLQETGDKIQRILKKEVATMKRLMFTLMAVCFLLGACATVPMTQIQPKDLPDLKGTWTGTRELTLGFTRTFAYASMEIANDNPPITGKITLYIPDYSGNEQRTYPFENLYFDEYGRMVIKLADENLLTLSYYKGTTGTTKKMLYGSFSHKDQPGTIVLYKQ